MFPKLNFYLVAGGFMDHLKKRTIFVIQNQISESKMAPRKIIQGNIDALKLLNVSTLEYV